MAQEILSSVITVARFIYEVYKANEELKEEEQELANTVQILLSSVQGLQEAGNYIAALNSLLFYLNEARKIIESFEKRRAAGKKWVLTPKAQLTKIKALTEKLMKVTTLLGAAFGANINRLAETGGIGANKKGFDSLAIIGHASAKKFWRKHVGSEVYSISWQRFKLAFAAEYKTNLPNSLLSEDNYLLMKAKLDPDGDSEITVYEFAEFTDSCGVLKSFIDQVSPHGSTSAPPSRGTRDAILRRTVFLDGGFTYDFASCTPLRLFIEEHGTLLKWAKSDRGMLLEMCEDEAPESLLGASIPDKFRHRRLALRLPTTATVDDALTAEQRENDEREREAKDKQVTAQQAEETSVAQVELQVIVMDEQAEQKQEECNNQAQADLAALEVKMAQMIAEIKSSDQQDLKQQEEELRKKFEQQKQSVIVTWRTKQEELDRVAQEEKDKVIKGCQFQRLINTVFTKPKSKVNEEFHARFPTVDQDENCLNYYHCSENSGKFAISHCGLLYVTRMGLYFFSSSLGGSEVRKTLKFEDLFSMAKTSLNLWPNSITFMFRYEAETRSIQYSRFISRDAVYSNIEKVWMAYAEQFLTGKIQNTASRAWYMATGFKVVKEGWLDKKGDVIKNYKRRWFTLTDRTLSYHKEKGSTALRTLCLQQVGDVRTDEKSSSPDKHHFLILTKARTFRILSASVKERSEWVSIIKECMSSLRYRFYYGLMQVGKSCEVAPHWVVLEMNFNSKKFLIWKDGSVIITINFNQLHLADRGSSPLSLNILLKDGREARYAFQCQTLDEREYLLTFVNGLVEEMNQANQVKEENLGEEAKVRAEACTMDNTGHEESLIRLQQLRGVILKKTHVEIVKSFSKRYIVLEQLGGLGRFMIYKDDTVVVPLEIIALNHVVIMTDAEHPRVLALHAMGRSPFVFRLETQAMRDEWIVGINSFLKRAHTSLLGDDGFGRPQPIRTQNIAIIQPQGSSRDIVSPSSPTNVGGTPFVATSPISSPASNTVVPSSFVPSYTPLLSSFAPTAGGILGGARSNFSSSSDLLSPSKATRGQLEEENRRLKEDLERQLAALSAITKERDQSRTELQTRTVDYESRRVDNERRSQESERRIIQLNRRVVDTEESAREMERQLIEANRKNESDQQRLVNAILKRGNMFVKHQKKASPNPRFIFLAQDGLSLCWSDNEKAAEKKKFKDIKIRNMSDIKPGFGTEAFKARKPGMEAMCFSVISSERSLDLQAPDQLTRDVWVDLLRALLPAGPNKRQPELPLPIESSASSPMSPLSSSSREESKQSSSTVVTASMAIPGAGNVGPA